ncbi:MAG: UDP-N-acetylmuramate dehydrogenase [Tenericutes bacterium]|nr:UDP-N-acetylmuramate dehydrogenase [Mycoplasmatota bacterium]
MNNFILELEKLNLEKIENDISLSTLTTYKTGGIAKLVVYPNNINNLKQMLKLIHKYNIKYFILGKGSNTLFSDKEFNGVIIKLDKLNNFKIKQTELYVESGMILSKLVQASVKNELTGLEFAIGIPGTIGGAIYMNAGAYGNNMSNIVKSVIVLNEKFQIKEIPLEELKFDYRYSIFQDNKNLICVAANIKLEHGNHDEIASKIKENLLKRKNSQPLEYPSAGSVFRNPKGNYAGKIIEELGLKGKIIGGAEISTKHANFIINKNNASSSDILNLIKLVQKEVKDKYKIDLKLEQQLVNW